MKDIEPLRLNRVCSINKQIMGNGGGGGVKGERSPDAQYWERRRFCLGKANAAGTKMDVRSGYLRGKRVESNHSRTTRPWRSI